MRLAGLWTLCLTLLSWSAEATGLHACAHHARIAHTPAAAAHQHGDHQADHGGTPTDTGGQHERCTCASGCPTAAAPALPAALAAREAAAPKTAPLIATAARPRRLSSPHVLPFAQAPPRFT